MAPTQLRHRERAAPRKVRRFVDSRLHAVVQLDRHRRPHDCSASPSLIRDETTASKFGVRSTFKRLLSIAGSSRLLDRFKRASCVSADWDPESALLRVVRASIPAKTVRCASYCVDNARDFRIHEQDVAATSGREALAIRAWPRSRTSDHPLRIQIRGAGKAAGRSPLEAYVQLTARNTPEARASLPAVRRKWRAWRSPQLKSRARARRP